MLRYVPYIFIPIAIAAALSGAEPVIVFVLSAAAIVPLAHLMGLATEELAARTSPTIGGLLNATFGNAAELIIGIFALRAGLIELVKASITGSIIGNLLLILGLSLVVGGVRFRNLKFNARAAGMNAALLALAVVGLGVPALFDFSHPASDAHVVQNLSYFVAGVMLLIYVLSLLFTLVTHRELFIPETGHAPPKWTMRRAIVSLVVATVFVAWLSEILVGVTEETIAHLGVSEFFLGVIVIPLVGNAAEHGAAVLVATRNKIDLSFAIAVGSSTQIALFVGPLLVFISLFFSSPLSLSFNAFEVAAVALATGIVTIISLDGESHWLEGAQLLAVYGILAAAFFFF